MSPTDKKHFGFTLIEVLVFISILVVILGISFSLLLITFNGSSKNDAMKEVKQNGEFALSLMKKFALSAREVECSTNSLTVTMLDGTSTVFLCEDDKISSNSSTPTSSSTLTNDNVVVSNCVFTCTANPGTPAMVGIGYTVETVNSASLRVSEKTSLSFSTEVIVRNQK